MHFRFLVTFKKEYAATSKAARHYAAAYLDSNDFVGQQTRWSGSPADWYVIGGRWSGELTRVLLPHKKREAVEQEFEAKHGWYIGGKELFTEEQRREQMRVIFMRHFPDFTGELPYWRDNYQANGYEDDAMIVSKELYTRLLKAYEGSHESESHADLDYEDVSPQMIDKKWIVVVDYHT